MKKSQRFKLNLKNKEDKKHFQQIVDDCWKAANHIVTCQQLNEYRFEEVYCDLNIDQLMKNKNTKRLKEMKKAEKQVEKKGGDITDYLKPEPDTEEAKKLISIVEDTFFSFFGKGRKATTQDVIKKKFPNLPPSVTNRLNNDVFNCFNKEKKDVGYGKRSLRSYRQGMPVPVTKKSVQFAIVENNNTTGSSRSCSHIITWKLSRTESIQFKIIYGKDSGGYKTHMEHIINGKTGYDYGAPSFQIKKGIIYLLIPMQIPQINIDFKNDLCVGVDIGMKISAYCGLSKGLGRRSIGDYDDYVRVRCKLQSQKRRCQKSLTMVKGGHGRAKKLRALERYKEKERNFVHTYNHMVSSRVVKFALQHRAGVIKLEFLKGFSKEERDSFVLRNWGYYEMQSMIEYKAKEAGISVVYVDPYHTSQTCSNCGHYEPNQRLGRNFKCASCGSEIHADYNASLNIARSTKIVTKESDCELYKIKKAKKEERFKKSNN